MLYNLAACNNLHYASRPSVHLLDNTIAVPPHLNKVFFNKKSRALPQHELRANVPVDATNAFDSCSSNDDDGDEKR